jgi:hypothetical protein
VQIQDFLELAEEKKDTCLRPFELTQTTPIMHFFQTRPSLFEVQPGNGMNTPLGFQAQLNLNNLAMLPVMNAPSFNRVPCPTPQLLPSRSPANVYNSNLKAQARIQTQQIDSAIHLLKMQYDAIMASVQQTPTQPLEHTPLQTPLLPPLRSTSATSSPAIEQTSFAMHFELPDPESDEQSTAACPVDTKRKFPSDPDGILVTCLADSDSCSPSKNPESTSQSKKRIRRQ